MRNKLLEERYIVFFYTIYFLLTVGFVIRAMLLCQINCIKDDGFKKSRKSSGFCRNTPNISLFFLYHYLVKLCAIDWCCCDYIYRGRNQVSVCNHIFLKKWYKCEREKKFYAFLVMLKHVH